MKTVLIALLSWLAGILTILVVASLFYEIPGIVDAVSYMILLFFVMIVLVLFYLPILFLLRKKFNEHKVLRYTPLLLAFLVNLPAYIIIWYQSDKVFGYGEAVLFFLGLMVIGLVFGVGYSKITHSDLTT